MHINRLNCHWSVIRVLMWISKSVNWVKSQVNSCVSFSFSFSLSDSLLPWNACLQVMSEIELHRHVATGTLATGSVMSKTVKLLSSLRGRHQHPDIDVLLSQSVVCCCHFTPVGRSVQSGTRSLCGLSDFPPLRTILCQRKCIVQRHASVRRDCDQARGSRTSTWAPPRRVGRISIFRRTADREDFGRWSITTESGDIIIILIGEHKLCWWCYPSHMWRSLQHSGWSRFTAPFWNCFNLKKASIVTYVL